MKALPWRSAALVTLGALLGRALGVAREAVFAHEFGASFLTDAYLVAVLIPMLVQNLVAGGTLQAAFVPLLADEAARAGRPAAHRMVVDLAVLTTVALTAVALALVALAEPIVRLTASGFSSEAALAAASMLRWCAWLVVLNGFLAVALGGLNTFGSFATTASLSPLLNAVQIAVIIALGARLGIYAAVAGVLSGTLAQCLQQLPALRRSGIRLDRLRLSLSLARRVLPAFVPAALASLVAQGNPLADKVIGSYLVAGSITHLSYAELFAGSIAVVTTSVALVTFPTMSTALAEGEPDRALHVLRQALHVTLIAAVPASMLLGAFAPDIVRLIYGWGRLSHDDLRQVARCVLAYAVGIPFTAVFHVLTRACYAIKRPAFALGLSVAYLALHTAVGLWLAPRLGPAGLAMGTSAGAITVGLGGWFLLRSDLLQRAGSDALGWTLRLVGVAAASIVGPAALLQPWGGTVSPAASVGRLTLAAALATAVLVPLLRRADAESWRLVSSAWSRLASRTRRP